MAEEIKNILVTGATGLIGTALVETLMADGRYNVFAAGRNESRAKKRFSRYAADSRFHFFRYDVRQPLCGDTVYHYIIHAASGADPRSFADNPVGVMTANIDGVRHLLDYGRQHGMERFLYISSGEVYGVSTEERDFWNEDDSGYVNTMSARSCYPSAKRAAETLCAAYAAQYGLDVVVARPCHTYGPCFTESDNRVYAQFLRNVISGHDIVMKSSGEQFRSWIYADDCAEALVTILFKGESGLAYNVADEESCVTIRQLAEITAKAGGKKVVQDTPHIPHSTPIMRATFDTSRLRSLGWRPRFTLSQGIAECLRLATGNAD